jgi:predicted signal transduction protein with EAL and GGDEF domain
MLLPATDLEGAQQVARRVIEAIRSEAALHRGVPLLIRASLGVAEWEQGWDAGQLIEAADKAMYLAKRQGRDQLVCRPRQAASAVHLASVSSQTAWQQSESVGSATTGPRTSRAQESTPRLRTPAVQAESGR